MKTDHYQSYVLPHLNLDRFIGQEGPHTERGWLPELCPLRTIRFELQRTRSVGFKKKIR